MTGGELENYPILQIGIAVLQYGKRYAHSVDSRLTVWQNIH